MRKFFYFFISPGILLSFWWIVGFFEMIDPLYLPSLPSVINSFITIIFSSGLGDIWSTLYKTIVGLIFSVILAVPVGVLLGVNKKLYAAVEFTVDFFRSLPAPALFPLFLLFFGIGDLAKIAVVAFVAFWVILVNTIYGVWNAPKLRIQVAKVYGASRWQILKEVVLPDAIPQIFVGFRVALSLALVLVVITEMLIGTKFGLGQKIFDSYVTYHIPSLFSYILIIGLLGYILNKLFVFFEKKIVYWV